MSENTVEAEVFALNIGLDLPDFADLSALNPFAALWDGLVRLFARR